MNTNEVVIVSGCRTPIGSFRGALSSVPAPKLGALVIKEALKRANIASEQVNEVIMGNVIQAGVGQAPARQAAIYAGLPVAVETMTVNKVCGSGLKAVMLGAQSIMLGHADVVVAGGMESMSNAPYLLDKARAGYRMGHAQILDSMMRDGLLNVYDDSPMGNAAELCARECHVPRDKQDEFAILSYSRAQESQKTGRFAKEIVGVEVTEGKETKTVVDDEDVFKTDFSKIPKLKSAFMKDGSVTAANSSKINDGAAALVLMSAEKAKSLGVKPLARIVAQASSAKEPLWFTTAPADGINNVLSRAAMSLNDIDLFEINEAFAVVALAVSNILALDVNKLNVNGGAVALGHPIGASGARILVTLLHALEQRNLKRGLAAICIGGGESSALIVERV
ncbi:MAG: thiolase family protein [Bacteroidetes bacterium]|nr:thiolase family protein [Bacteroidota bacterium]MCW5896270.1 thiolase family protein [Bacteroidota bacterium]